MTDLLGEALARWDENHPARPMTTFYYSQVVAAARNWEALTNPTDELIERVARAMQADEATYEPRHSLAWEEDDPEYWGSLTRAAVDALTADSGEHCFNHPTRKGVLHSDEPLVCAPCDCGKTSDEHAKSVDALTDTAEPEEER